MQSIQQVFHPIKLNYFHSQPESVKDELLPAGEHGEGGVILGLLEARRDAGDEPVVLDLHLLPQVAVDAAPGGQDAVGGTADSHPCASNIGVLR